MFFSHYFCMFTFKYHLEDTPSLNMLLAHWIHIEFNFIHTLQLQFIAIYSRNQLFAVEPASSVTRTAVPAEFLRMTHRGCRGGTKWPGKKTGSRQQMFWSRGGINHVSPLSSGAAVKMVLTAIPSSQTEFQGFGVTCFIETWLLKKDKAHSCLSKTRSHLDQSA